MEQTQVIEQNALSTLERAKALVVVDTESYVRAGNFVIGIKSLIKEVEDTFEPIRKKAHDAWQETLRQRDRVRAPLDEALKVLSPGVISWEREQERLRVEEEKRLQAEQAQRDEEAQMEEALRLEQLGDKDGAAAVIAAPALPTPIIVPKSTPKIEGLSMRTTMDFRITDPAKVARLYCKPDEVRIRAQVKALGKEAEKVVGGIQVFESSTLAGRIK